MNNRGIELLLNKYSSSMDKNECQELFDLLTNIPDDLNEKWWAENIIKGSFIIKNLISEQRSIDLLLAAYDEYKTNYPNSFENKAKILRMTFDLQMKMNRPNDAHRTMNRYLFNSLAQVRFITKIPKMRYFSFRGITDYSIEEIETERIYLAHPRVFNDPLDTILVWWLNKVINTEINKSDKDFFFRLMMKKASEHIKIRCLIGSKFWDRGKWKEQSIEDLSVLMWAHYAMCHTGMCVEFDFDRDFYKTGIETNENELVMIAPVRYSTKINLSKGEPSMRTALFQKSNFWKYEKEMRLCSFNVNNNDDYPFIGCKNAIKGVYLGVKCGERDRRRVEKAIGDKEIPLFQMIIDEDKLTRLKKIQIG